MITIGNMAWGYLRNQEGHTCHRFISFHLHNTEVPRRFSPQDLFRLAPLPSDHCSNGLRGPLGTAVAGGRSWYCPHGAGSEGMQDAGVKGSQSSHQDFKGSPGGQTMCSNSNTCKLPLREWCMKLRMKLKLEWRPYKEIPVPWDSYGGELLAMHRGSLKKETMWVTISKTKVVRIIPHHHVSWILDVEL